MAHVAGRLGFWARVTEAGVEVRQSQDTNSPQHEKGSNLHILVLPVPGFIQWLEDPGMYDFLLEALTGNEKQDGFKVHHIDYGSSLDNIQLKVHTRTGVITIGKRYRAARSETREFRVNFGSQVTMGIFAFLALLWSFPKALLYWSGAPAIVIQLLRKRLPNMMRALKDLEEGRDLRSTAQLLALRLNENNAFGALHVFAAPVPATERDPIDDVAPSHPGTIRKHNRDEAAVLFAMRIYGNLMFGMPLKMNIESNSSNFHRTTLRPFRNSCCLFRTEETGLSSPRRTALLDPLR